jgi:hypothetical protein
MATGAPTREQQVLGIGLQNTGDPKITQAGSAGWVQEDVAALEISMDDAFPMRILQRLDQRQQRREDLPWALTPKRRDITAVDILHGDEHSRRILMKVEDPHDVGMREAASVAALLTEQRDLLCGRLRRDELGHHLGTQILVSSQPDIPHATPSQVTNEGESRG